MVFPPRKREDVWKVGRTRKREAIQKKSDEELTEVAGMVKRPVIIATRQHGDPPGMNNLDMQSLHVQDEQIFHVCCAVLSGSVVSDSVTP